MTHVPTISPASAERADPGRALDTNNSILIANKQDPTLATGQNDLKWLEVGVLQGRCVVPGVAQALALVTRDRISGWGGVDPRTGTVVETRHELRGQSFAGRVLVFPGAKGSSGWSAQFHIARLMGTAPAAWLFNNMNTKMALGAVVSHAPAVTDFDRDPLSLICTGDRVHVDATQGRVTVWRLLPA